MDTVKYSRKKSASRESKLEQFPVETIHYELLSTFTVAAAIGLPDMPHNFDFRWNELKLSTRLGTHRPVLDAFLAWLKQ